MSDELNSQLSAFVDDELTPEESELFVRRLCRDETLRRTGAYYGIIGDILRGESSITTPNEFAARVMMAVEGQSVPVVSPPVSAPTGSMRNWGFALAASVALAVVALMTLPDRGPAPGSVNTLVAGSNIADSEPPVIARNIDPAVPPDVANTIARPIGNDPSLVSQQVSFNGMSLDPESRPDIFNVPMVLPATAENRAKLNSLLLQHLNSSGASRQQGLVSFRNVGFVTQTESQR